MKILSNNILYFPNKYLLFYKKVLSIHGILNRITHYKETKMIKLFTHNDLDGLSCALLAKLAFGTDQVDFESCRYEDINEKVEAYIEEKQYENYTHCFITDISIKEELAIKIDELLHTMPLKISLIDHHISAQALNSYRWCHIEVADHLDTKTCGTSLFYRTLKQLNPPYAKLLSSSLVRSYVEKVRRYDVWDWQTLNDIESKQLNDLFYILGKERFIDYWEKRMLEDHGNFSFDEQHTLLLELKQNEIDKYIEARNEELIVKEIAGYTAGIVFVSRFQSELGNALAELHPELDFIAMINLGGGVSCRTIKTDVNLAEIASLFGGGGHAKAAGIPIPQEIRELVIDQIFHLGKLED